MTIGKTHPTLIHFGLTFLFQIADRMYARHDGTRSYFFNIEEMKELAVESGLEIENISYCERMTVNKKENVEAKRLFLQARFLDTIISVLTWS